MWTKYTEQQRMDVMKRLGYGKRKNRNVDCVADRDYEMGKD